METEAYKRSSRAAAVQIKQLVQLNFNLYYKICSHTATQTGQHMLSILQTHAENKVSVPKKAYGEEVQGRRQLSKGRWISGGNSLCMGDAAKCTKALKGDTNQESPDM